MTEVAKHRANAGARLVLHFYRDRSGVDADLLVDGSSGLVIVETKAGATVTPDLVSPARRVADVLGARASGVPRIVHGGDSKQERSDCVLLPWNSLSPAEGC